MSCGVRWHVDRSECVKCITGCTFNTIWHNTIQYDAIFPWTHTTLNDNVLKKNTVQIDLATYCTDMKMDTWGKYALVAHWHSRLYFFALFAFFFPMLHFNFNVDFFCCRDGAELLLKYKPETVNYVLSHRNNFNSNGVNSENAADGSRWVRRATLLLINWLVSLERKKNLIYFNIFFPLRPSSHCSFRSCAEEEIEAVRDKINVSDIDQVVDRLK